MPEISVPGEGPYSAPIAFIGEAPGEVEQKHGCPFIGKAGELFDKLLSNAAIYRSLCYVTNVVKTQPPNNDMTKYIDFKKSGKNKGDISFITDDYRWYEEYLYEELNKCSANVLVPLGNTALYALTRKHGVINYRGSILPAVEELGGRKVIPTLHPASALRQDIFSYHIARDLRRIKEDSESPLLNLPVRHLETLPSLPRIVEYLTGLLDEKEVAYDIEIYNMQVSCIAFSTRPDHAICIPFISGGRDIWTEEEEALIWLHIAKVLENKNIVKIAQYGNFDNCFLHRTHGIRVRPLKDTMIAHFLCFPEFPKGLDYQTSTLTREPYYKDDGKEAFKGGNYDEQKFWEYNAKDACLLTEIHPKLDRILADFSNTATYERVRRVMEPLAYMQLRGIRVDLGGFRAESAKCDERLAELLSRFQSIAGPLNPKSSKQMITYFYGSKAEGGLGIKPYINRKTKKPSTDEDALKRLAIKGVPAAVILNEHRKVAKLKSSYWDMRFQADNRFRGTMNPAGTKTGRYSSGQEVDRTGGNTQNVPRAVRRYLIADEGGLLIEPDLSQAENRIVAFTGPEPTMRQAFIDGVDIHCKTAGLLYNIPPEEVSKEEGSSIYQAGKSQRDDGKQCNHAFNYGLGYKSFSYAHELPETIGKLMRDKYHRGYPMVEMGYQKMIRDWLYADRKVTNPYGRTFRFLGRLDQMLFQDAYAFFPQSTVADKMTEDGICELYYNPDRYYAFECLNQVHDSAWIQAWLRYGYETIAKQLIVLCKSLEKPIPWKEPFVIPSDVKVGFSFGEMLNIGRPSTQSTSELAEKLERAVHKLTHKEVAVV